MLRREISMEKLDAEREGEREREIVRGPHQCGRRCGSEERSDMAVDQRELGKKLTHETGDGGWAWRGGGGSGGLEGWDTVVPEW
jgi:hypothetical protein